MKGTEKVLNRQRFFLFSKSAKKNNLPATVLRDIQENSTKTFELSAKVQAFDIFMLLENSKKFQIIINGNSLTSTTELVKDFSGF